MRTNHKLPSNVEACLMAALRQLTQGSSMSDRVRAALIDDPNVKIYLDTWVTSNLKNIRNWNEGFSKSEDLTITGGR